MRRTTAILREHFAWTAALVISAVAERAHAQQPSTPSPLAVPSTTFTEAHQYYDTTRREIYGAQDAIAEHRRKQSSGLLPLPVVYFSPETDLALGVYGMYYFHDGDLDLTRASNVQAVAIVTTRKQIVGQIGPDLWLNNDALHLQMLPSFRYFPDSFWGIGNETSPDARESFTERSAYGDARAQLRLVGPVYAGARAHADFRDISGREDGKQLVSGVISGEAGGFYAGGGPVVTIDSRDNVYAPSTGLYAEISFQYFPRVFGDFDFGALNAQVRQYVPIGDAVLAFEVLSQITSPHAPFYALARLGGPDLRGITLGRYRDNHMVEGDAELRLPLWGRWGTALFVGTGEVARNVSDFRPSSLHVAGGYGLRYAIVPSERINIRLDFAYSDGLAYYLDIAEAF